MSEANYIVGEVLTTFFENAQNFYKVLLVRVIESNCVSVDDEIVVTGIFGQIHSDISYRFNGKIVSHPKYGEQFQADNYQQTQPTGKRGLIQYFSSTHFPGIGEKTAEKIVEKLGEDALERIINDSNALDGITGLTKKKKEMIREVITQNQGTEKLMFELTNLGFTPSIAQKIIGMFKEKAKQILDEDPYLLLQKIEGLGFRRMDSIAQSMGINPDDASRLKGALFIITRDFCYQTGDTYISSDVLITQAQRLLESCQNYLIDPEKLVDALNDLIREGVVYSDESRISIASLYYAELGIRNAISRRVTNEKDTLSKESINKAIQKTQEKFDIIYDESQKESIHQIMNEPIFVLTGGPGTGKTTIINAVIDVYCQLNEIQDVEDALVLAAPTGRAAKRMNELTGFPSSTIHRLLGIAIDSPEESFEDKEIKEKFTQPPKHFTEDTLLKSMEIAGNEALEKGVEVERKGLGTPATRAGIIENLIYKGFVERDKKNLIATHKGISLVTIVSDTFKSAETTAKWEMELADIAKGKSSKEEFLEAIENEIKEVVLTYSK